MASAQVSPHTDTEGPLRSLAHKAASTNLVRRARQGLPSFAEDAVTKTASHADAVLNTVDTGLNAAKRTMETEEGQELAKSATAFGKSLVVFVGMLAMSGLSQVEDCLGVKYEDDSTPCAARRVATVARVVKDNVADKIDKRETQVAGTFEADLYAKARWVATIMTALFACIVGALAKYEGPASEYVAPVAQRVAEVLPKEGEGEETSALVEETSGDGEPSSVSASQVTVEEE